MKNPQHLNSSQKEGTYWEHGNLKGVASFHRAQVSTVFHLSSQGLRKQREGLFPCHSETRSPCCLFSPRRIMGGRQAQQRRENYQLWVGNTKRFYLEWNFKAKANTPKNLKSNTVKNKYAMSLPLWGFYNSQCTETENRTVWPETRDRGTGSLEWGVAEFPLGMMKSSGGGWC